MMRKLQKLSTSKISTKSVHQMRKRLKNSIAFLGATKHLYNWLCPSVGRSVGQSVCLWRIRSTIHTSHLIGLLGLVLFSLHLLSLDASQHHYQGLRVLPSILVKSVQIYFGGFQSFAYFYFSMGRVYWTSSGLVFSSLSLCFLFLSLFLSFLIFFSFFSELNWKETAKWV